MTYVPAKFAAATSNSLEGDACTRKHIIWPRSHTLLSTFYIMWPIYLQGLKLLRPTVKEEMHLQDNTLFNLWPWGQGHINGFSVPSTPCGLFTCKVWACYIQLLRSRCIYKKIHYSTFDLDLGVKVTWMVAQYPLHHVAYLPARFEVATSNC